MLEKAAKSNLGWRESFRPRGEVDKELIRTSLAPFVKEDVFECTICVTVPV